MQMHPRTEWNNERHQRKKIGCNYIGICVHSGEFGRFFFFYWIFSLVGRPHKVAAYVINVVPMFIVHLDSRVPFYMCQCNKIEWLFILLAIRQLAHNLLLLNLSVSICDRFASIIYNFNLLRWTRERARTGTHTHNPHDFSELSTFLVYFIINSKIGMVVCFCFALV